MIYYSDQYKEIRAFELAARQAKTIDELYTIQDRIKYWLRVEFRDTTPEALEVKKECESVRIFVENKINILISQASTVLQGTPEKTFEEYFVSDYRETFPQALKREFIGKKGKWIRLMIEVLKAKGIISGITTDAELFRAIKTYFGGDIGSRVAIFQRYDFNIEMKKFKKDYEKTLNTIENILKELQKVTGNLK